MASVGPNYPSVGESVSSGDANEVAWGTPENIQDADTDEATIVAATFDSPDPSFYLVGRGFGFAITAGSTIDGITVEISRRSIIASSGIDVELRLRDANGALIGDNKADTGTVWPGSLTVASYGGTADTWNTGLSAANLLAMVNDADFGVSFQARANIANADIGVSFIRVTIEYTPPASTPHTANPADTLAVADATTASRGLNLSFSDSTAPGDSFARASGWARAAGDSLILADNATPTHTPGTGPALFPRQIAVVL